MVNRSELYLSPGRGRNAKNDHTCPLPVLDRVGVWKRERSPDNMQRALREPAQSQVTRHSQFVQGEELKYLDN